MFSLETQKTAAAIHIQRLRASKSSSLHRTYIGGARRKTHTHNSFTGRMCSRLFFFHFLVYIVSFICLVQKKSSTSQRRRSE